MLSPKCVFYVHIHFNRLVEFHDTRKGEFYGEITSEKIT